MKLVAKIRSLSVKIFVGIILLFGDYYLVQCFRLTEQLFFSAAVDAFLQTRDADEHPTK